MIKVLLSSFFSFSFCLSLLLSSSLVHGKSLKLWGKTLHLRDGSSFTVPNKGGVSDPEKVSVSLGSLVALVGAGVGGVYGFDFTKEMSADFNLVIKGQAIDASAFKEWVAIYASLIGVSIGAVSGAIVGKSLELLVRIPLNILKKIISILKSKGLRRAVKTSFVSSLLGGAAYAGGTALGLTQDPVEVLKDSGVQLFVMGAVPSAVIGVSVREGVRSCKALFSKFTSD